MDGEDINQKTWRISNSTKKVKKMGLERVSETKYPFAGSQRMGRYFCGSVMILIITTIRR